MEQEKINALKAKHGHVFMYEVEDENGEVKRCYLKKPDRKVLSAAAVVGKNDPLKYNELLIKNCWLEGDDIIKDDDAYFLGLSSMVGDLIEIKQGELKKL